MAKNLIIGTAGHIDHGKSTLIKALTGTDTDRLDEEKKRGISIDIGFSKLNLSDDINVGIIDVPGHEKFIKNMLAGAGGVDLVLLVIAADEGFMAQTREHLDILDMLNVQEGIIVISKIDLVDEDWLELVIEDVREKTAGTFLDNAPLIKVSPIEKKGLEKLKSEIRKLINKIPAKNEEGNVYLPVDRVFTIRGHGTIVTGTLIQGNIKKEDKLMLYPAQLTTRVRSIQVHNEQTDKALPGQRVGINLSNIEKSKITRGDVLAAEESLEKTSFFNAILHVIPSLNFTLKNGDRIRFHLGAREIMGRVYLFNKKELFPGEKDFVHFKLEEEAVANFKEHFVIRRYSPMTTVGGGMVLDTKPVYYKKTDDEIINILKIFLNGSYLDILAEHLKLAEKGSLTISDLMKKCGLNKDLLRKKLLKLVEEGIIIPLTEGSDPSWIHYDIYDKLRAEIKNYIQKYHDNYHLRPGVPKDEIKSKLSLQLSKNEYNLCVEKMAENNELVITGSMISLAEFSVEYNTDEKVVKDKMISLFLDNIFNPPDKNQIISKFKEIDNAEEIFASLLNRNEIMQITEGIYLHKNAVAEAKKMLCEFLKKDNEIDVGQFRDLLQSSRKYALPLLEYFDRQGVTTRVGDKRKLV